ERCSRDSCVAVRVLRDGCASGAGAGFSACAEGCSGSAAGAGVTLADAGSALFVSGCSGARSRTAVRVWVLRPGCAAGVGDGFSLSTDVGSDEGAGDAVIRFLPDSAPLGAGALGAGARGAGALVGSGSDGRGRGCGIISAGSGVVAAGSVAAGSIAAWRAGAGAGSGDGAALDGADAAPVVSRDGPNPNAVLSSAPVSRLVERREAMPSGRRADR